jgi:phosphoribosylformimino-5-aminoimidazole carboxamide ribotide isomerase
MVQIIPAIDLIEGKVVRLKEGKFASAQYYSEPFKDLVERYLDMGFPLIHVVDLDGAREGSPQQLSILDGLQQGQIEKIQWSGGLRSIAAIEQSKNYPLDGVVLGSILISHFELFEKIQNTVPANYIRWALDIKENQIAFNGWTESAQKSYVWYFQQAVDLGIKDVVVTSVAKDGMNQGPDFELYSNLRKQFPTLSIVASGGVGDKTDLENLKLLGVKKAIVGRSLLESKRIFL